MKNKALIKLETHEVPALFARQRLQEYAAGIFKSIASKKGVKNAIKKGLVFINAEKGYTGDWISGGETIDLYQDPVSKKPSLDFDLTILYEDDYLAVINKPAGVLVSGNKRFTVENALEFNLTPSNQDDALNRSEPIHRLDYPTTGALLVGKTASSVMHLNKLFEERKIHKTYFAVAIGVMDEEGMITSDIDGKPSRSHFKKVATMTSEKYIALNLLTLTPHTGRRHQLRKHLAELGNPIFGDATYAKEGLLLKGKGLYLHAHSLNFPHPNTGKELTVTAPFPKKFKQLFPQSIAD